MDNGSTDERYLMVKKFGGTACYVFQEKGGISITRNKGLERARGNIISFIDSDEIGLKTNYNYNYCYYKKLLRWR